MHSAFKGLLVATILTLPAVVHASTVTYQVTVDTTSLIGNPNGAYAVDFQMNYGSGTGNTATVSNFNVASSAGTTVYGGNPTGTIESGFSLTADSTNTYNEIAQQFVAGSTLSFQVTLTQNGTGLTPDALVFSIDDNTNLPLLTTSSDTVSLATFTINPYLSNPAITVNTFAPTDTQYAGMNVTVNPVPLPASAWLMLSGMLGLGALVRAPRTARATGFRV